MYRIPEPPKTLVTRQIECVSCKELFVVSEDNPNARERSVEWRLPSEDQSEIQLRYAPDRTRRPVTPVPHSIPTEEPARVVTQRHQKVPVNCPRCGADNRNWLRIMADSPGRSLSNYLQYYWQNLKLVYIGWALTAVLLLVAFVHLIILDSPIWHWSILLFILVAGFLPIYILQKQWRTLREYKILPRAQRSNLTPTIVTVIGFLSLVFVLPLLFLFIFPGTLQRAAAWLSPPEEITSVARIDQILRQVQALPDDELTPLENGTNSLTNLLEQHSWRCGQTAVAAALTKLQNQLEEAKTTPEREKLLQKAIEDIQALQNLDDLNCKDELVTNAVSSITALQDFDTEACNKSNETTPTPPPTPVATSTPAATPLPKEIVCNNSLANTLEMLKKQLADDDENPSGELAVRFPETLRRVRNIVQKSQNVAVKEWVNNDLNAFETYLSEKEIPDPAQTRLDFVGLWYIYIFLACIISLTTGFIAVHAYVGRVAAQLPHPIFHSLANMTRVVVWEAKHALEINGDTSNIQWSCVGRNEQGGIILQGLYRASSPLITGNAPTRVRAQLYTINTDIWGRIESADIQAVLVPPVPETPEVLREQAFFRRVSNASVAAPINTR